MVAVVMYSSTVLYFFTISTFICVPCIRDINKKISLGGKK